MTALIPIFLIGLISRGALGTDPKECYGANEVYTECDNNSCLRDCSTFGLSNLFCRPICTPGCICARGYLRNSDGECVKPLDCGVDVCPEKNQEFVECLPCGRETCQTLGTNTTCNTLLCTMGCDCKPGFYRNDLNACVPASECVCGGNQELDLCYNPCPPESCDDIGKTFKCGVPSTCTPACKCKKNFKRNSAGECIDIRQCPQPFQCDANQTYDACPGCVDERCVKDTPLPCASSAPADLTCKPQCRCNTNFCRDSLGKCVEKKTPVKCGPNEFFSCGSACDTTCAKLGEPCNIINKKCTEMCYCKEGFARNDQNVCIPVAKCPPKNKPCVGDINVDPANPSNCKSGYVKDKTGKCVPKPTLQCGANEEVDSCATCADLTCEQLFAGESKSCTKPPNCPVACRCKAGFYRNHKKECVKEEKCCKDPNAEVVSSPNPCPGGTCQSPLFSKCKVKVLPKGCQCKAGYLKKSATDSTCVLKSSCY